MKKLHLRLIAAVFAATLALSAVVAASADGSWDRVADPGVKDNPAAHGKP